MSDKNKYGLRISDKAYIPDDVKKIYDDYIYYYAIKEKEKEKKNWKKKLLEEMRMNTILTVGIVEDDLKFLFKNLYNYSSDLIEAYLEFMMYLDRRDKYKKCPLSYFYSIVRDHDYVIVKDKKFWTGKSDKEYWEHYDSDYVYEHMYVASNGIEIYKVYSKAFQ